MSDLLQTHEDAQPSILPAEAAPRTPLAEALDNPASMLVESRGVTTVACFSDAQTELSALVGGAGVFDLGARVRLRVTGDDRVRWLNGMVTNTVKALAPGSHNYTFILNAQGRIQGDATVFAFADHLILETDRAQAERLFAHLDRFIIMDDVELAWVEEQTTLGLAGPGALALLGAVGLWAPEASGHVSDAEMTVVREDSARYSLWAPVAEASAWWQKLLEAGATPAGADAVEALRVLTGTPLYGIDITDKTLAQETGQMRALNFNKGCYLGQEIVERVRSRATVHRGIRQFALRGELAERGALLTLDGAAVGELTSVARVGLEGFPGQVALGTVRTEAVERSGELRYPGGVAEALAASLLAESRATPS